MKSRSTSKKMMFLLSISILFGLCSCAEHLPASSNETVATVDLREMLSITPSELLTEKNIPAVDLDCAPYNFIAPSMESQEGFSVDEDITLTPDQNGGFYLLNRLNHELVHYDGTNPEPVNVIQIPDSYFEGNDFPLLPAMNSQQTVFPYQPNRIGIWTLDGEEQADLQLPFTLPRNESGRNAILLAPGGGIYIVGASGGTGLDYYSAGWETGSWVKTASSNDIGWDFFAWNEYLVAFNWKSELQISLYKTTASGNFLEEPVSILDTGLGPWFAKNRLDGMDQEGRFYVTSVFSNAVTRYSIIDQQIEFGAFPENFYLDHVLVQSIVTPDGSIFILVRDADRSAEKSTIYGCHFPNPQE